MKPQDEETRKMAQERISSIVREARAVLGHSQAKVAADAEISEEFLGRIERCEALPSIPTLMRLSGALGISISILGIEVDALKTE